MTLENETVEGRLREAEAQIKYRDNIIAAMNDERREFNKQLKAVLIENSDLKRQIADLSDNKCKCHGVGC